MAVAINGPMPGTVINRRSSAFSLALRAIPELSRPISGLNCARAAISIPSVGTASEGRSLSGSSTMAISFEALAATRGTTCPNSAK